ncbi:MAG TPA: FtsX-like permease family protein, partial [Gemmatimonadaceae bacterium]
MRETMPSIIYTYIDQDTAYAPGLQRTLYVRTAADPSALASTITSAVHDIDPTILVHGVRTFAEQRLSSMSSERLIAILAMLSGAIALLLATIGLYGLVLFDTQRRTREIGVRVALGATPRGIVGLVLRGTLGMIVGGSIAGVLLSQALSRFIAAQLYGVKASDPTIVGLAFVTLGAAAIVATIIPAWRASRVNPVEALRCE